MRWLKRMVAQRSAVRCALRKWVLAGLTTIIVGAAGLGAPNADASVKLTGFSVDQSSGVTTAMAPVGTDPEQRAAADLPPHDESVGTLAGSAGVDGGAATYTVPITVPPGRAGMQPSVSLHYSSRGGDGVMGVGWSLSAGGAIHRCPQTVEQDGNTRGVDYTNNDRLCLDGMRLVAVSGTYGFAGTQYRTEIESFARITQVGGDLASNTACFRVDDKSGRVRHYGAVTQGALSAVPTGCLGSTTLTPTARVQPAGVTPTLSWALVKEEDRVGNFQHFTYTNYGDGELLLASITYTDFGAAAGDRTVIFDYKARTSAAAGATDVSSSYLGGGLTMQTQALASITTRVGATPVRIVTPSYSASSYSKRLVLTALSECAPNAAGACNATNTHPATTFTMSDGTLDFRAADLSAALHAGGGTSTSSLKQLNAFGDLNGDGTREVMLTEDDANGVSNTSLAQLTPDRQAHEVVNVNTLGVTCLTGECTGDFLGQGRTSVLKGPASVADPQVLQIGTWGLGRQDVATSTTNLLSWKLTDIPVSYVPGGNTGVFAARDFNGDGRLDISLLKPAVCAGGLSGLYVYLDSGPDVSGTEKYVAPGGALVCFNFATEVIDHIADLDGDGLPDFVLKTGALQASFSRILFTRRNGSVLSTTAATCSGLGLIDNINDVNDDCHWYSTGAVVHWMDVNGDGLEDFVIATRNAPTWRVRFNNGGHFDTKLDTSSTAGLQKAATDSDFRYASSLPPMDIDGDGKPELLIVSSTRDFAMRVCSFKPFTFTGAGTECPSGGAPVPMTDALTGVTVLQCPAYACPEDPRGNGGDNLPIPNPNQYGNYNGNVIYRMYQKGAGDIDSSTYHLAALKFVRTGATSVTAQVIETPLISELGATPRTVEDVFGDGLADLVTPVGCTRKPQPFISNTGGMQTYPGCMIVDDATYGVASIDLYPSLTAESATAIATSGFASTYKTHINQNYGAKASAQARAAMAASSAAASAGLRVANAAPPPMPVLPDMLALTRNGVGEVAAWSIVPLSMPASQDGVPLYDLPQANGYADSRHFYFTSTMPVVSGFVQSNGVNDRLLGFRSAIFGYGQAMYNVQGRGFAGFRTIVTATAPALNPNDPNYNPTIDGPAWPRRLRTTTTYHQKFPLTGEVASVVVTKQDTAIKVSEQTSTYRCASRTITNYAAPLDRTGSALCPGDLGSSGTPAANTVYFPFPDTTTTIQYDPDLGTSTGYTTTVNASGTAASASGFDANGNLLDQVATTVDQGANVDLTSAKTAAHNTYPAADTSGWWLDKLTQSTVTKTVSYAAGHTLPSGASAPTQAVTTDFTWNTDRTPQTKTVQSGIANQQSTTTYCYAPTTNAILNGCPAAPVGPTSYGLPTQVVVNAPDLDAARSPTRTTAFTYTKNGSAAQDDGYFVYTTTNALGHVTTTTTAPRDGQPLTVTDANLVKTANTYDVFGRLTQTTLSDKNAAAIGTPTQSAWTKCSAGSCPGGVGEDSNEALAAWRVTTVHAGAPTQVGWFDVLGRPIKQASGGFDESLVATLTDYDALGTVALQSTPYKVGLTTPTFTSTAYDAMGRPTVKVLTGSSLDSANGNQVREYAYSGRTTTVTVRAANKVLDANGNCPTGSGNLCFKVSRRSNTLGQLMHTVDANNGATDFWPGANGPLVAMTDAEGNRTQATVNELGQRTQSIDPDQGTWKFTYDALGELLTQTDARGAKTTITARDTLGRTKNQTIVPPTSVPAGMSNAVFADSWSYDPVNGKGLLDTTTRRRGTDPNNPTSGPVVWQESTAYDIQARTKTVTTTIADGGTQTLAYDQTYDTYNRPQTMTYPSNLKVETLYTAYGQRSELRNAETLVSYWVGTTVDAWGHITSDGSANGVAGLYVFDPDTGQATSRSWTKNAAAVTSVTYGYDSFANVKSQTRSSNTETYGYDTQQRLTSATRTNGGVINYGYTASGNLFKKDDYSTNGAGAYSYAPANSLVNLCGPHAVNAVALNAANGGGSATFVCDANGNVIGGSTITAASFAADNKPVSITRGGTPAVPDPSCATSIADRLFCSGFQPATPASGGAMQTWAYASDGSKVYETSSRGSTWFGRFGYEKNGTSLRHELGPVVVARNGGVDTVTTILSDRLGSTVATVDGAGTNERAYDAFGQVRNGNMTNKSPATLAFNQTIHGFTQHEHADDVRLIHMGGRVYDPVLGRFLSVDPIIGSGSQGINPYSYIGNNPLSSTDPSGYQSGHSEPDSTDTRSICFRSKGSCAAGAFSVSDFAKPQSNGSDSGKQTAKGSASAPSAAPGGASGNQDKIAQPSATATTNAGEGPLPAVGLDQITVTPNGSETREYRQAYEHWILPWYQRELNAWRDRKALWQANHDAERIGAMLGKGAVASGFCAVTAGGCVLMGAYNTAGDIEDGNYGMAVVDGGMTIAGASGVVSSMRGASRGAVGLGPYAGDSIPARSPARDFTAVERARVNEIGTESGCHTCGTTNPGTKSGNFVPDHQPPTALNAKGDPQRLYPHCINCSREQGLEIARQLRQGNQK